MGIMKRTLKLLFTVVLSLTTTVSQMIPIFAMETSEFDEGMSKGINYFNKGMYAEARDEFQWFCDANWGKMNEGQQKYALDYLDGAKQKAKNEKMGYIKEYSQLLLQESSKNSYAKFDFAYINDDDIPDAIVSTGNSHINGVIFYVSTNNLVNKVERCNDNGEWEEFGSWGSAEYIPQKGKIKCEGMARGVTHTRFFNLTRNKACRELYLINNNDTSYYINGEETEISSDEYYSKYNNIYKEFGEFINTPSYGNMYSITADNIERIYNNFIQSNNSLYTSMENTNSNTQLSTSEFDTGMSKGIEYFNKGMYYEARDEFQWFCDANWGKMNAAQQKYALDYLGGTNAKLNEEITLYMVSNGYLESIDVPKVDMSSYLNKGWSTVKPQPKYETTDAIIKDKALTYYKSILKRPTSLELYSINLVNMESDWDYENGIVRRWVYIDGSALNGFGGYTRSTSIVVVTFNRYGNKYNTWLHE